MIPDGKGRVRLDYMIPARGLIGFQTDFRTMTRPGEEVYEGQIAGLNSRESDLTVNPLKGKKLTNMRAAGRDDNVDLTPATRMTLEQCLEFIEDDELVEVTPESLRLRKRHLKENDRKRAAKAAASV